MSTFSAWRYKSWIVCGWHWFIWDEGVMHIGLLIVPLKCMRSFTFHLFTGLHHKKVYTHSVISCLNASLQSYCSLYEYMHSVARIQAGNTVEPWYKDHLRAAAKVVFIARWSLYKGGKSRTSHSTGRNPEIKVKGVKVKGHIGQGQIRVPKKGRLAHINVKLLHLP